MTITHRTTTAAAIFLSLALAGVPAAIARPTDFVAPASEQSSTSQSPTVVFSRPDRQMIPVSSPATYGVTAATHGVAPAAGHQPSASAVVRVQTPQNGFHWGDAGIGAAGGIALLTLGLGGALMIFHRRPRRTSHDTALPS